MIRHGTGGLMMRPWAYRLAALANGSSALPEAVGGPPAAEGEIARLSIPSVYQHGFISFTSARNIQLPGPHPNLSRAIFAQGIKLVHQDIFGCLI